MALKITTTVRNIDDADPNDFAVDGDHERLQKCQEEGAEVTVVNEVCIGYYDIVLQDGTAIDAVSWYHLDGFTSTGIDL